MRLVIDTLIALMLVALLAGVIWHHRYQHEQEQVRVTVHRSLAQLHEQVLYRKTLEQVERSDVGFPLTIDAAWFDRELPRNTMAPASHPWMDVAPPGDHGDHPPDPVLTHPAQAGLWYNPNRGIFRARVPEQLSQGATLRLYNELNGTTLSALPQTVDATRRATPHDPPEPASRVVPVRDDTPTWSSPHRQAPRRDAEPPRRETPDPPRRTLLTRPHGD